MLKTKRSIVRYVSHEVRTPLNSTLLGLKLIHNEVKSLELGKDSILLDLINDSYGSCNIAVDVMDDLLMYEKIESGLLHFEPVELPFWNFIKEILTNFKLQVSLLLP